MSAMNIHKTLRRIEVENSNIILYKTLGKSIRIDTKNSFIGYIKGYFFSESIFRYESVPPKRIGPVGNCGTASEETDEKYRRNVVQLSVAFSGPCVIYLCCIFDTPSEEPVLSVALYFDDKSCIVSPGASEVEPDAFGTESEPRYCRDGTR